MSERIEIVGYAPDADPTNPGVLTDCTAMVPALKGFLGAPAAATTGVVTLAAKALGAAVIRKLDNTTRLFAGTQTKIYEAGATSWTDQTRASGAYTGGSQSIWRFCQFGNVTIAAQKQDLIQSSTSGAFADISAAPKAKIVETVNQFVFAFDTNEATYGDSPDRWWCSGLGDQTIWTPAVATQAATGRLTATPGPITAGRRLGDNIVVYKDRGVFVGVYVGPPTIWAFQEISSEVGAPTQEAVVPITKMGGGMAHIFMGYENFYFYDGSIPIPVPGWEQVVDTFFADLNRNFSNLTSTVHDRAKGRIYFYYVSIAQTTGVLDKCLVYNYRSGKWGRDNRTIEAGLEYIAAGTTYNGLGALYSTYNDMPNVPYDSPFWVANAPSPAIIDNTHLLQTLTGQTSSCDFTTGDLGEEDRMSILTRARLEYITAPTTATMTNYYRQNGRGDSLTTDATATEASRRFDVLREAKWHRLKFSFTGNVEVDKLIPDIQATGIE